MMVAGNAALRRGLQFTDPAQMAADCIGSVLSCGFGTGLCC